MKKILIFIPLLKNYGGAERRFARLVAYIRKRENPGIDLRVLLYGKRTIVDEFANSFFSDLKTEEFLIKAHNIHQVVKSIFHLNPDVLHIITVSRRMLFLYFILFLSKLNIMLSVNSYEIASGNFKDPLQRFIFKCLLRPRVKLVDCLYPSKVETVSKLLRNSRVFPTPIPFTDLEKYKPVPVEEKENIIVFASRFIESKNPIVFIQSISLAKNIIEKYSYKVIMCGDGPLRKKIMKAIKEYDLENIIQLPGFVDTSTILPRSKIFVSIQSVENYPSQSLIEAISSGNYIIASNVGDTGRIVQPDFGILVELDPTAISQTIGKIIPLLESKDFLNMVISSSWEFALENFRISNSAEYFLNLWLN